MAVGNAFGEGFGHKYGTLPLEAWHAMLRPEGWDRAGVDALRSRLDAAAEMLR